MKKVGKNRILIIDDEEFSLSALEVVLKCANINVEERVDLVMSGKEALELIQITETNGVRYSLILTDISMPQMNGIELTKEIKKIYT